MTTGTTRHSPQTSGGEAAEASAVDRWLQQLAGDTEIGRRLQPARAAQLERGYGHTLREIAQQPLTWRETASALAADAAPLRWALEEVLAGPSSAVVLTGSGSSLHAAECLALPLQESLGVPVTALAAGVILTHPRGSLPPRGPYLVTSLARSGNSPESRAVVDLVLKTAPHARHLVITCNRAGALATAYRGTPAVRAVVLDDKTHDRSLVMTSSFTNLVLAGLALGVTAELAKLARSVDALAAAAERILAGEADALARLARGSFRNVAFLGSGCRLGAAREAALKMLEMTEGRVGTLAESYLGLRHGPLSAVHDDTLVVAFLSSAPVARAYELDLLREMERKQLGYRRLVVGTAVPGEAAPGPDDIVVDCAAALAPSGACDAESSLIDVLVGQLLAFFRCLELGLRPDAPSTGGVITRVVDGFAIHDGPGSCRS